MSCAPPRHSVTSSPVISTWMPPGMGAQRAVHLEEALHLVDDAVEVAGLVAGRRLVGVAVHRVALPDHLMTGGLDLLDDRRQQVAHLVVAQPADQRQPARLVVRIEPLDVLDRQLRASSSGRSSPRSGWRSPRRTRRARRRAGGCARRSTRSAPDRSYSRGSAVDRAVGRQPQHGPLVVEHQSLVAGVDFGGLQVAVVDPAGAHERAAPRSISRGQRLVAGARRRGPDELAVPVVHQMQRRPAPTRSAPAPGSSRRWRWRRRAPAATGRARGPRRRARSR